MACIPANFSPARLSFPARREFWIRFTPSIIYWRLRRKRRVHAQSGSERSPKLGAIHPLHLRPVSARQTCTLAQARPFSRFPTISPKAGPWNVEDEMKAAIALILIYVGTFLVAIQGGSSTAVQAASQSATGKQSASPANSIDPTKEADIRSLLELIGFRDQVQENVNLIAEQYREKLLATVPNNEKGQAFVNGVISGYEKNFDVDQVTQQ